MRRHPVENHADAMLMQLIDQIHQVLRLAVARRRRKVAGGLISPGTVEGMLTYRQKLDMRKTSALQMLDQRLRELAIGKPCAIRSAPPRTQVHLVDRHRRLERIAPCARRHPVIVIPRIIECVHDGRRLRRLFAVKSEGVRLLRLITAKLRNNAILVDCSRPQSRDKSLPDAGGRAGP
jgi:hypothetical protein